MVGNSTSEAISQSPETLSSLSGHCVCAAVEKKRRRPVEDLQWFRVSPGLWCGSVAWKAHVFMEVWLSASWKLLEVTRSSAALTQLWINPPGSQCIAVLGRHGAHQEVGPGRRKEATFVPGHLSTPLALSHHGGSPPRLLHRNRVKRNSGNGATKKPFLL